MAQNSGQTLTTLEGMMKDNYSDKKLEVLVPAYAILKKEVKFEPAAKPGKDFIKAVALTREHGFSYGSSLTENLQSIISANVDDAKVRGTTMTLRAGWDYDAAAAMASSQQAFMDFTSFKFVTMMDSASFRLETQMIHGSKGILVTDASSAGDTLTAAVGSASGQAVVAIDKNYWSDAIAVGLENANISFFLASNNTTALTANGPDSPAVNNKFPVVSVDLANKTVTVQAADDTEAGKIVTACEAAAYNVYFYGAKAKEMVGLRGIVANTGDLFGISGASYSAWVGNSYACGSARLSLKAILSGVGRAVGRGLSEKAVVLVNPQTFATLANDEAALRSYTAKTTVGDRGVAKIEYVGSNGPIEVISHPLVWESQAIAFPIAQASRIGLSDLTFNRPGTSGEMIFDMQSVGGIEARLYSNQAIFLPKPGHSVLFSAIDNSAS